MASRAPLMLFSFSPDSNPGTFNNNPDNPDPTTASGFTNIVNYLNGSGLSSIVRGIDLDDGWYNVSSTWPTNGTVNFAHTNGEYVELWIGQNSPITNGVGGNYDGYIETNKLVWVNAFSNYIAQGFDSIKLDPSFGVTDMGQDWSLWETTEWMKTTVQTLAGEMGRSVAVSAKGNSFSPLNLNGYAHWDYGLSILYGTSDTWQNMVHTFINIVGGNNFGSGGCYPFYPEFGDFNGNLTNLQGFLSLAAIAPLSTYLAQTNLTAGAVALLTNTDWQAIYQNISGTFGYMVYSNNVTGEEIWIRSLGNNEWGVCFANLTYAGSLTDTIIWPQLGIPSNVPMQVRDVWNQTNAVFTGSFTYTTPSNCATLFRIGPGLTTNVVTGGVTLHFVNGVLTGAW